MSEAQETKPAAKGGMKKTIMLLALALLIGGGGGAGAWWMLGRDKGESSPQAAAAAAPVVPPVFLPLDAFTVNLRPEPGGSQHYIQVGVTLKISGDAMTEKIKGLMPEIRNHLLLLLSSKTASELLHPEGKTRLAQDLRIAVASIAEPAAVPANPKKTAVKVAAAAGETRSDAAENAAAEGNGSEAEPAETAEPPQEQAAPANPVLAVLFTSFIIQ
ncbi:MAG: flagellar basal body-associated FliL family protein [Burkholderiales bacterium]